MLARLGGLLGSASELPGRSTANYDIGEGSNYDEDEGGEEGFAESAPAKPRAPGAEALPTRRRPKKEVDLVESLEGQLPELLKSGQIDVKDFLLISALMKMNGRGARKNRGPEDESGNSDEERSGGRGHRGLRQINDLEQITTDIHENPKRIIREFEISARKLLGVGAGMAWTLQDLRRVHH